MRLMALVLATALLAGTALAHAEATPAKKKVPHHPQTERLVQRQGKASYYNDSFQGKKTATGEKFSQEKMTAASKDLPLGSRVTVTNKTNGKSVDVEVNDRGPYVKGRVIDLSKKAATEIGITRKDGVAPVKVEARPSSQPTEELKQQVGQEAAGRGGIQEAAGSSAQP
jgi:rare lipoprotein A